MAAQQLARGLWTGFAASQSAFNTPNGMDENLRTLDDHLALYTLQPPLPAGAALPASPAPGTGQIFSDGSYAVFNGGTWKRYGARNGITVLLVDGAEAWQNNGSGWSRVSVLDVQPAIDAAQAAVEPLAARAEEAADRAEASATATGYLTRAAMDSVPGTAVGQQARVTNDPAHTASVPVNGYYVWNGAAWVRSALQPAAAQDVQDLQALVKPGQRLALNVIDEFGFLLFSITETGGLLSLLWALQAQQGGDTFRIYDSHGFVGFDSKQALQRLVRLEAQAPAVNAYPNFGGQLSAFKAALCDPFCQFIGAVLCGDSNTWGLSASGIAASAPRGQALTDPRNNGTAPTWANLLHQYLGRQYFNKGAPDTTAGWSGSPSGDCQFTYTRQVRLLPRDAQLMGAWTRTTHAAAALKKVLATGTTAAAHGGAVRFTMTGYAFSVVHEVRDDGAPFEVFANGVSLGVYETSTSALVQPAQLGYTQLVNLGTFKRGVQIEVRAKSGGVAVLALEAIEINRVLRVTNQGIIGTNSTQWASAMFAAAVRADDAFAIVQIGTNDRIADYGSTAELPGNLALIAGQARARGIEPVLMCPNATTDTMAGLDHVMRGHIVEAASELRLDLIDNFGVTREALAAGSPILADGLHLADSGHAMEFNNIIKRLEG